MKILTIGNGFIANSLQYQITKDRLEPSYESISKFIDEHVPDVLINAIGYCGSPNIDACELNKQKTFDTNTLLPIMLASECAKRDIYLVNIGSGCVFAGESPNIFRFPSGGIIDYGWREFDSPTPLSTYSKSKYATDLALQTMSNVVNLRIRMPISPKADPRNLLSKLTRYSEIVEIPNSVTFVSELSRSIEFAIDKGITGTYHITSSRPITHSKILKEYQEYVPAYKFISITPSKLDSLVTSPRSNCILSNSKIVKEGFVFEDQDMLLKECVKSFAENTKGK